MKIFINILVLVNILGTTPAFSLSCDTAPNDVGNTLFRKVKKVPRF